MLSTKFCTPLNLADKKEDIGFVNRDKIDSQALSHSSFLCIDKIFNKNVNILQRDNAWATGKHRGANPLALNRFRIKGKACFASGTPVLASKGFMPIEEIDLGDFVWANKYVANISPLVASLEEEFDKTMLDPWASDDQRWVDDQDFQSEAWYRISLELEYGDNHLSVLKLLRPKSWIKKHKIDIDSDKIWISMPEQGLEGYATLTSLENFHVRKKPNYIVEEQNADLAITEVTGIFIHASKDVWKLYFENIASESFDSLSVTSTHPIFSLDYMDWRQVSELNIGERVLTKLGELHLSSKTKLLDSHQVYNLEVREFHNFLVGKKGIVVHNSCWVELE
jgi:hypothetical protein